MQVIDLCEQATGLDLFSFRCSDPTGYTDGATTDGALTFLWSCCDSIFAYRSDESGKEFVEFDNETPDDITVISTSEKGLLYHLFTYLIEDQDWENEEDSMRKLREGADRLGFDLLADALDFQSENGSAVDFADRLLQRTQQIV